MKNKIQKNKRTKKAVKKAFFDDGPIPISEGHFRDLFPTALNIKGSANREQKESKLRIL